MKSIDDMTRDEAISELKFLNSVDFYNKVPILELPNFISDKDCDSISEKISSHLDGNPDDEFSNTVRLGKSIVVSDNPQLKDVDTFLFENFSSRVFEKIKKHTYYNHFITLLNGKVSDNGFDFHRYIDSDHCIKHADNVFHHPGRNNDFEELVYIFASCSLCLNTPKEGGEIIFPNLDKSIKSEKGKVVVWSPHPFYEHYTTPTPNDYRDVIITWMVWSDKVIIDNEYYDKLLKNQKVFSNVS